ncbi:MAG: toxin-antitoxin system YwqK family antitoxin, partial [Flavobacteriales bacterium]
QASRSMTFKQGRKSGKFTEYFESGKPKLEATMRNDDFEGTVMLYFPDGKVWQRGQYRNGLRQGVWSTYDENGKLEAEDKYRDGKQINPRIEEEKPLPDQGK